jgi:hypothetical protein
MKGFNGDNLLGKNYKRLEGSRRESKELTQCGNEASILKIGAGWRPEV